MEEGDKKGEGLTSFIPSLAIFSVLSALEAAEAKRDPRVQESVWKGMLFAEAKHTHLLSLSLSPPLSSSRRRINDDDWHGEERVLSRSFYLAQPKLIPPLSEK